MRASPSFTSGGGASFRGTTIVQDVAGRDESRLNLITTGVAGQGISLQAANTDGTFLNFLAEI